ncbi:MAG: SH3 domain protein [Methylophagaceae bacterium]
MKDVKYSPGTSDKMINILPTIESKLVNKLTAPILLSLILITPLNSLAATTRFVSDKLEITMRNGQGVKFAIKRMLTSGTKLSILETDTTGYTKVRTPGGSEGWVLTRYLTNTPSARNRVASSEQKAANLELELAKSKEEVINLSSQNSTAGSQNMTLKETAQRLKKELDDLKKTASNAVGLDNENRQLKSKIQQTDHKMQSLISENNALKDSDAKDWFLIGAAVLFGGIILGLMLPKLRLQKKNSWGSF